MLAVLASVGVDPLGALPELRNRLSQNENFTYDSAERTLDSVRRLMRSAFATPRWVRSIYRSDV